MRGAFGALSSATQCVVQVCMWIPVRLGAVVRHIVRRGGSVWGFGVRWAPWFGTLCVERACVGVGGAWGAGIRHAVWGVGIRGAFGALVRHVVARVGV